MKVDLFNTEDFIKINNLKEISDPVLFLRGATPSPLGLLSTDIFGISRDERKRNYAYIDLGSYFFNPFIYKLLKRVNRNFEHAVHSTRKFKIVDGDMVEDENGETGLSFLYKNWEKIKFKKNTSLMRGQRVDLLSAYNKNVIFTKYWLVIPAFYRDVNLQNIKKGKLSHHEINDKYSKLIRMSSLLKGGNNFEFVMDSTKASIQECLVEIYDLLKGKIEKKQGMIRRNVLGKSIDYGARVVISAPKFDTENYDDMPIDFYHSGVPLVYCCSLFTPFIMNWCKNYFRQEFEQIGSKYPKMKQDGTVEFIELDNPAIHFDDELLKKELDRFIKTPSERFAPIELPVKDKNMAPLYFSFSGRIYEKNNPMSTSTIINRPATWLDIFYQAAVDIAENKMVYITRYPITDYFGTFPNEIMVLSTTKTMPVIIGEKVYDRYPYIDLKMSKDAIATSFHDTVSLSNLYLKGLGGDYDGDQISIRGLFTQEANEEARELMRSKSHILNVYGENMRKTTNEGIQTLYTLTKF